MRTCCQCAATFTPTTKNGYRCPPCRKVYDAAWRNGRKAAGMRTGGNKMPREYHRAYEQEYFKNAENRARRNALMRKYANAPETRDRHKARWLTARAIKSGAITRQPCEVCGSVSRVHAHHDNYSMPLDVRWLCQPHHVEHHAKAEGRQP